MENSNLKVIVVEGMGNEALKENSIRVLIMEKLVYDIIPRNQRSNPKGFRLLVKLKLLMTIIISIGTFSTYCLSTKVKPRNISSPRALTRLSLERLQRAFLEKFELNIGVIYIQHPATSVRYELEDVTDVENFSVLELIVKAEQGK
jgi:Actin interacting protein 3